jgi:hypothetical protein
MRKKKLVVVDFDTWVRWFQWRRLKKTEIAHGRFENWLGYD